jgi:hypothetical protein
MKKKLEEVSTYNKQLKVNYGQKYMTKVMKEEEEVGRIKKLE